MKTQSKQSKSFITDINCLPNLSHAEKLKLEPIQRKFPFRVSSYYLRLIDWNNPNDPLRNIVIPDVSELNDSGPVDVNDELLFSPIRGIQHKFSSTCLLLVSSACAAYCRFCFRKRLFSNSNSEVNLETSSCLSYLERHKEIDNVLLTGGDPFMLGSNRLLSLLTKLNQFDHIRVVRIGTKVPAFYPDRITQDEKLLKDLAQFNNSRQLYVMTHFSHWRELTTKARRCLSALRSSGCVLSNQTSLLASVNDDPSIIARLFNSLAYEGVSPYYLLHCKPTVGNKRFQLPLVRGLSLFCEARLKMSGLASRARYLMVNRTGKIEILGWHRGQVILRCHEASNPSLINAIATVNIDPTISWLDRFPGDTEF